ncbi:MAG: fibronectin type III domain-containing protein [Lachnospiraceae bacterium]
MKKQWKKLTCLLASVVFFISVSLSPDIVLGAEFEEKAIKDICLNIGSDETEKNITWLGTSRQPTMVQVLEGSADVVEGSAFTSSCVDTFMAVQDTATITGYKTNKATITKLKANTKYFYRVGNEEQWSKTYSFKTNSFGINQPFHFFFIGDTQIGARESCQ